MICGHLSYTPISTSLTDVTQMDDREFREFVRRLVG